MNTGEALAHAYAVLTQASDPSPKASAEELIAHLLGVKRLDIYLHFDRPIPKEAFTNLLTRRSCGEPLAYAIGEGFFGDIRLTLSRETLIPRPETEILVHQVCDKLQNPKTIVDLCTGSGCIAIALQLRFPEAKVIATDISAEALAVARSNAAANGAPITFYEGDLLEPLEGGVFDLIMCNPPYISEKQYLSLHPSVREYEPKTALVGGTMGWELYASMAPDLHRYIAPGGMAAFEIGYDQGESVPTLFSDEIWHKRVKRDWAGHDRFFFLEPKSR